jgi:hypothetical protein
MQVFISWSGARSRAVAEILDEWIQCVLQAIRPWMSSKDIDRGSLWFAEITDQLKDTKIGIICLTKDNINKPWILFESGALAKGLSSSRVCTFLIDLDTTEVGNPLAQFNHTLPNKDGLYELVRTLNSSLGEQALREKVLEQVYETYWPKFEQDFQKALEENPPGEVEKIRSEESILGEMLDTLRSLDRRIRTIESSNPDQKRQWTSFNPNAWPGSNPYLKKELFEDINRLVDAGISPSSIEDLCAAKFTGLFTDRATRKLLRSIIEDRVNRVNIVDGGIASNTSTILDD